MGFRDLDIRSAYETLTSDPVSDFYVPALRESVKYDRIAGFFTSSSLALAARGISGLISNGGHMRLIVSPKLTEEDLRAIKESGENPAAFAEAALMEELDSIQKSFEDDHVRALGWMLANGLLELKIACVVDDDDETNGALFHQKVGILEDAEGECITFSGSVNETASGWLFNSEEFKVFKSWELGDEKFIVPDKEKFDSFWQDKRPKVKVVSPSEAFRNKFVSLSQDFDIERLVLKRYKREKKAQAAKEAIPLFFYQSDAVSAWEKNGRSLLFEMATGTGKTRTAIACVNTLLASEEKLVCVVAAPEITLARQWQGEFENLNIHFDDIVFADSSSGGKTKWLPELTRCISRISIGRKSNLLVMTTHDTAGSDAFTETINAISKKIATCLVGDEVHGMGATKRRRGLLARYNYRIGLSATPARWFDDVGTELIAEYFGGNSFEFTIFDAQTTINPLTGDTFLTPYVYRPIFLQLDSDEMERYLKLTDKIAKIGHSKTDEAAERRNKLLMQRADITKNAASKIPKFEHLVRTEEFDNTLVFTSPQQIKEVCEILANHKVAAHPFTMNQGTRKTAEYGGKSEREHIIECFKEGSYQTLVAISCLDEGIDIPCAEKGILLSSSTNPREYIQRVGRVIRRYPGKVSAEIVDFIVEPDLSRISDPDLRKREIAIFAKELRRVGEMAGNATNSTDVLFAVNERLEKIYGLQ